MSLVSDNRAAVLYFDSNKTEDKETYYTFMFLYGGLICEAYNELLVLTSNIIHTNTHTHTHTHTHAHKHKHTRAHTRTRTHTHTHTHTHAHKHKHTRTHTRTHTLLRFKCPVTLKTLFQSSMQVNSKESYLHKNGYILWSKLPSLYAPQYTNNWISHSKMHIVKRNWVARFHDPQRRPKTLQLNRVHITFSHI